MAKLHEDTVIILLMALAFMTLCVNADLYYGYYKESCPKAEDIVKQVMVNAMKTDPGLGAAILRMHFHDCFVEGCDGSILIDSTPTNVAEKDFPANNPSIRGFEVIDAAKAALEKECPGVVSCADILAFAARDGVGLSAGPCWNIRSGRKDGRRSKAEIAGQFLLPPFFTIEQLKAGFAVKKLNADELVTLSGGHTLGISHCSSVTDRLYNFTGKGDQDPSLDPQFARTLRSQCPPNPNPNTLLALDDTPLTTDTKYFTALRQGRAVLASDAALLNDPITRASALLSSISQDVFFAKFVAAMIKMSEIEVKTGYDGEIRKNCRVINPY